MFDALAEAEKRRVDDVLNGQVLWSRRSGGKVLCGDSGSAKRIYAFIRASVFCGMRNR